MTDDRINNNLYDCLLNYTEFKDDDTAVEYLGMRFSFSELKNSVEHSMRVLHKIGLQTGDRVVLSLITTPDAVFLLYACSALGIVPVMADIRLTESDYESLMERVCAKHLFINDFIQINSKHIFRKHPDWCCFILSPFDATPPFIRAAHRLGYAITRKPSDTAVSACKNVHFWKTYISKAKESYTLSHSSSGGNEQIIFTTSGTTGSQKYVVLKSFQLNLAALQNSSISLRHKIDTVLSVMPLFACYGFVGSVHMPLMLSKTLLLHPIYEPSKIPSVIMKYKPNFYAGVFDHFEEMLRAKCMKNADLSFLKMLYFGGERGTSSRIEQINSFLATHNCPSKLYQGYGMTEVASVAVMQQDGEDYRIGSVGRAMPYTEISVINRETNEVLPAGEEGEICLHTPCQMQGYLNDEAATNAVLHLHDDGNLWVHTGDVGYLDNEGFLFITGRIKHMLVSENGTKIFPSRIEDCVSALPNVAECAVATLQSGDTLNEIQKVLFAVPSQKDAAKSIKDDISAHCRQNLPSYLQPDSIIICKSLPKTESGKIDYYALEKEAKGGANVQYNRR